MDCRIFPPSPRINLNFVKGCLKSLKYLGYQDHSEPTSSASVYLPIFAIAEAPNSLKSTLLITEHSRARIIKQLESR